MVAPVAAAAAPAAAAVGSTAVGAATGAASWLGGAIGGAIGAAGSFFSGRDANRASKRAARENRSWQEYMSNTSHQREVVDLRAAGLNPILSANTGASTPSGAVADVMPIDVVGGLQKGFASGRQASMQNAELAVLRSQALSNVASAKAADAQAKSTNENIDKLLPEMVAEVRSRTHNYSASTAKAVTEMDAIKSNMATQALQQLLLGKDAQYYDADRIIKLGGSAIGTLLGGLTGLKDLRGGRRVRP